MNDTQSGDFGNYGHLAYGLIRQSKPKIILEIGLGESGEGASHMIDAILKNEKDGYDGKYYCIEKYPTKRGADVLDKSEKKATLIIADSQNPAIYKNIFNGQADLVFIDANHDCQNIIKEGIHIITNNILHINGMMVFHDTWMFSVRHAIKKLSEEFSLNTFYLPSFKYNVCLATFQL
mgnify:FL=1